MQCTSLCLFVSVCLLLSIALPLSFSLSFSLSVSPDLSRSLPISPDLSRSLKTSLPPNHPAEACQFFSCICIKKRTRHQEGEGGGGCQGEGTRRTLRFGKCPERRIEGGKLHLLRGEPVPNEAETCGEKRKKIRWQRTDSRPLETTHKKTRQRKKGARKRRATRSNAMTAAKRRQKVKTDLCAEAPSFRTVQSLRAPCRASRRG